MRCPTGKSPGSCLVFSAKIFRFSRWANHLYKLACPASIRGAFRDRHERGAGCGGRFGAFDEWRMRRTAKSCGPDAPTLASSSRKATFAGDGGKKARSPGRARRKPLKPLRGECRVFPVSPWWTYSCFLFFARETAGASRARHSLRPLIFRGRKIEVKLARKTRRDREGVFLISKPGNFRDVQP
jgi:hypothetical protein